jgi:hypothetical protein
MSDRVGWGEHMAREVIGRIRGLSPGLSTSDAWRHCNARWMDISARALAHREIVPHKDETGIGHCHGDA